MTVLLGPVPCQACREPVTVVRRPVMIEGHADDCPKRVAHRACTAVPSEVLTEVVVIEDGSRYHVCPVAMAHPFDYTADAGASGESNILNVALVSQLAPEIREPFHVGSKTT